MATEPTGMEQPKFIPESEKSFDLEQFKLELTQITEEYAEAAYITYGDDSDPIEIKEKQRQSKELFNQLLGICANALIATDGGEGTMAIIDKTLVGYQYKAGPLLFSGNSTSNFYRELSMRVAKK